LASDIVLTLSQHILAVIGVLAENGFDGRFELAFCPSHADSLGYASANLFSPFAACFIDFEEGIHEVLRKPFFTSALPARFSAGVISNVGNLQLAGLQFASTASFTTI